MEYHPKINSRLQQLAANQNDSLKNMLRNSPNFDLLLLTDHEILVKEAMKSTAWETAKSTGIVADFEYREVEQLNDIYNLQGLITDTTLPRVLNLYFDRNTHDMTQLDQTLLLFQIAFQELVGQESFLEAGIANVLENMQH